MAGDPDAGSFGDAGRLPACCWMHMDERARMELKTKLGRDWDEFRRARPTGRGVPMFLPSLELLEQFALVPDGFTVNWLRGPFIGMRDAAEDLRKMKEEEGHRAQAGVDVDVGGNAEAEENADARVESALVAAEERPVSGSPEGTTELADSDPEATDSGETATVPSAADAGKRRKRKVAKGSAMEAVAVFDLDAWSEEHRDLFVSCRIDIDELLSILRAPDCPLRVCRKKPQVASAVAEDAEQASI